MIVAAWEDTTPGNSEIFMAVSADSGSSFGTPQSVSQTVGDSTCFDFVPLGRFYYFVWSDMTLGNAEVIFRRVDALGGSAFASLNLSSSVAASLCPKIAVEGSSVYVAWTEGDIVKFRRSNNGGASFSATQSLGCGPAVGSIEVFGPNVHVIATRRSYSSEDGGQTIETGGACITLNPGDREWQRTVVVGTAFFELFRRKPFPGDNAEIAFSRHGAGITPTGLTLVGLQKEIGSEEASLLVSGQYLFAFWNWGANTDTLNFRRSTDGGATWAVVSLGGLDGKVGKHRAVLSGKVLFVVWENRGGPDEILYRRSVNIGASFGPFVNLSNTTTTSRNPALVVSGREVMVAWDDQGVGGNRDVFFRRSPQGGF